MKLFSLLLLTQAIAIRNPNFPTKEEIEIDNKLKKAFIDQAEAEYKAKREAKGPLVLQAEAKAKTDAELARVEKYVEDRREAAQAAKDKEDATLDA
jgi:hypothetical protein